MKALEKLPSEFFLKDSLYVAKNLIGTIIVSEREGEITSGRVTETESYPGWDGASHAYNSKITPRTQLQYAEGGKLYLYLIMGVHIMTSLVVNKEGIADVVFIRSIEPLEGIDIMRNRRNCHDKDTRFVASGPGRLTKALGINMQDNGEKINEVGSVISIYKDNSIKNLEVCAGKRINLGVSKLSEEEAQISMGHDWRFYLKGSKYLSL